MHLDGGAVLVVICNALRHCFGGGARQLEVQRHQHLHSGVIIAHDRHKGGRAGQAADLLHLGQVLVTKAQAVALGCIQLAVSRAVRALILGDHFFAAAGVTGDSRAAERVIRRGKAQLHQGPGNADEAAGIAAGHSHPVRSLDFFFLTVQLRETVIPGRVGAERRGGVQHFHIRAEQRHDLFGSRIRQAEERQVCRVDDLGSLMDVLAPLGGDAQQLDLRPGGQTVGDAQARGA